MKETTELINAIATLLWPLFAFTTLFLFKSQISNLITRLKKGKVLGQEIELSESLEKLGQSAIAIEQEVASLPKPDDEIVKIDHNLGDEIKEILFESIKSPKTALILLASKIERETRELLVISGYQTSKRYIPLSQAIKILGQRSDALPRHIPDSLKLFWEIRNQLIHGTNEAKDEDILRAIDSGITILKALQAYPAPRYVVFAADIQVFRDPLCKNLYPHTHGVILETVSPENGNKIQSIFPTTLTHFKKGMRVTWEWSFDQTWGEAWYKDSATSEIKPAWSSSAEFIGRSLDDL